MTVRHAIRMFFVLFAIAPVFLRPTSALGKPAADRDSRTSTGGPLIPTQTVSWSDSTMQWGSYQRTTLSGLIPPMNRDIRKGPLFVTGLLYASAVAGLHYYQLHSWWSNNRGPFHFEEDWSSDLQVDKFGHFFGGYFISYLSREALLECGFDNAGAHDLGSVMGLAYQLYIETEDGFSTKWGFSPSDAYADIAGAGFFFAQRRILVLQNIHEKWTYFPSSFVGRGTLPGQKRTAIDDYEGQTYWWSIDFVHLLPEETRRHFPRWLQVAVGYGAKYYGPLDTDVPNTREIFIGLDYNLLHLVPKTNSSFVNWLIQTCDNFHFPAPTLQVAPEWRFFLAYPVRITIGKLAF